MGTVIVGLFLVLAVGAVIRGMVRDKKSGKSLHCGGCGGCCGGHCAGRERTLE